MTTHFAEFRQMKAKRKSDQLVGIKHNSSMKPPCSEGVNH